MAKTNVLSIALTAIIAVSAAAYSQEQSQPQPQQQRPGRAITAGDRYNQHGDRIIDFFDVHAAELRSVIRQLSAYSGIDMIVSETARASVSISVTNRSWREILAIVCMVHNLTYVEDQGFIYVMTAAEATARGIGKGAEGTAAPPAGIVSMPGGGAATEALAPLVREVIPMRYVTAQEMSSSITPFLSQRGRLTTISHTNSVVIVDTDESLNQLKSLITQIDIQVPQVSISCKIVEVSSGVIQNMGVNWGYTDAKNNFTIGQSWLGENTPIFDPLRHSATYGVLSPEKFQVTMNYLFEDNNSEMVAQPQITTLNNKEATVFMGQQIPLIMRDDAGNSVSQMVNVGTKLTVTPYVSGDGKIMLTLNPSKESYEIVGGGEGTGTSFIVNEQSASTNVLVRNGETVVIAGLTSNEKQNSEAGIPFLKSIPIIGNLFKRSMKSTQKKDLVIFVTPHIIHPEM